MTSNRSSDELRRLLAEDPAAADLALFGRVSHADRRGFLRGAGLAAMSTAVGMAMAGLRPVAELQFSGFAYLAAHQLESHAARMRWRTGYRVDRSM